MRIFAVVKATHEEILEYFYNNDEALEICHYEKISKGIYKVAVIIPECTIKLPNSPITLSDLKKKVVKKCGDALPLHSMVTFADGTSRMIYTSTPSLEAEYAEEWARYLKTEVVHIKRMSRGSDTEELLYTPKLPKGFEQEDFNVDEWLCMIKENEEKIRELDSKAKENGSILYRFLYEPVADGKGIYQIIKVYKKTCKIRYCSTNGYNEYLVKQWGEIATVPMQYVLDALNRIQISKEEWDSIDNLYKGEWQDYYNEHPEWIGRKIVMSGAFSKNPYELGTLLIEDVHFIIV